MSPTSKTNVLRVALDRDDFEALNFKVTNANIYHRLESRTSLEY